MLLSAQNCTIWKKNVNIPKNHPLAGLFYLASGFSLISKPGIRRFVILPVCLNLIVFAGLFWLIQHYFSLFSAWFTALLPVWLQWTAFILWIFFFGVFFLLFIYTFATVTSVICAPFNNLLSEKVSLYLTGKKPAGWNEGVIRHILRPLGRQLSVIIYYLPRAVVLFMLSFIPAVQAVAFPISMAFSAWFITLQNADYPADNQGVSFQKMRDRLAEKRFLCLTFGMSMLFCLMVPVLNLLVIPAGVAGATRLWLENIPIPSPRRFKRGNHPQNNINQQR